ncbi:MAG: universal stress protein [Myxococcota bacterium]
MSTVPPKRILLATDLSDASANASRWAGNLVRWFDASLTVVHVEYVELPPYFSPGQHERLREQLRLAREAAARHVVEATEPLLGFRPTATRILEGPPADAIPKAAVDLDADLVVLGTHGHTGLVRLWLGSVASGVLADCARPVLAVHSEASSDPPARICVAEDDTTGHETAEAWGRALHIPVETLAADGEPPGGALVVTAEPHPERILRRLPVALLVVPSEP